MTGPKLPPDAPTAAPVESIVRASGCPCAGLMIAVMTGLLFLAAVAVQHLSHTYRNQAQPVEPPSWIVAQAVKLVPEFTPELLDPDGWGKMGMQMVNGQGLLEEGKLSAFRGPVPPLVFAAIVKMFGPSYEALLWAQCVLFALAGGAIGTLAQRLFGDRRITLLTMLIYLAFIPAYPWFCHVYSEPLFTLLLALFLLAWTTSLEKSSRWSLATGILLGVVALCRPVMYFFIPFVLLYELWRKGLTRAATRSIAAIVLGFLLLEVPWIVRNYLVLDRVVVMTTGGKQALFLATWYEQANWMGNVFHDEQRFPPAGKGFWKLPKDEQERLFGEMAAENFQRAPGKVLLLIPKRTMMFLFQMQDTGWLPTKKSLLLCGVLYPLAVLGYLLLSPDLRRRYAPLAWLVLFQIAFHSLLQAEYRYSHPVQPYIFLLSSAGLVGLGDRLVGHRFKQGACRPTSAS